MVAIFGVRRNPDAPDQRIWEVYRLDDGSTYSRYLASNEADMWCNVFNHQAWLKFKRQQDRLYARLFAGV